MNRYIFWVSLILTFSCSEKKETKNNEPFEIDSTFVANYKISGLKEIKGIKNYMINDNDDIFELAKTKMLFHEYKSFKLYKDVEAKVLVTSMTPDFIGDGTLKVVYLATFETDGNQINIVRIGKMEWISDIRQIETSEIRSDTILRFNNYSSIEPDTVGNGIMVEKKFTTKFRIRDNGRFERL